MKKGRTAWIAVCALGFASLVPAVPAISSAAPQGPFAGGKRHKSIEFEDELVEGMNKRPLDSVSQIGERERANGRPHLYRKRVGFRQENRNTLREMRYSL